MRTNKKAVWVSIIIMIFSLILLLMNAAYFKNNIIMSVATSLVSGAMVGIIIPLISYYSIRIKYQIEFFSLCKTRLNAIYRLYNWAKFNNIDYNDITKMKPSNQAEMKAYYLIIKDYDRSVLEGVELIEKLANLDGGEFYSILDDYTGLFDSKLKCRLANKPLGRKLKLSPCSPVKQIMKEIRNELAQTNYLLMDTSIKEAFSRKYYAFNGSYILNNGIKPYLKRSDLLGKRIENINDKLNKFYKITKIGQYTKDMQEA